MKLQLEKSIRTNTMAKSRELNLTKCPLIRAFVIAQSKQSKFFLSRPLLLTFAVENYRKFKFSFKSPDLAIEKKKVVDFHWRNFATIKLIQPKRSILTNWIQSIFFTKYRWIRSRGIIVPPEVGNRFNYPSHLKYIHINASEWYSSCYNLERRRMNGRQRWIDMIKYARCFFCMKSIHLHRRPDRTETNALTRDGRRPLSPDWTFHNNVA